MRIPHLLLLLVALSAHGPAHAGNCSIDLKTGDAIKYDQRSVRVSASCETITIHLTHTGKLPAATMGHNVVIAAADVYQAVAQDGMTAGLAGDYVKPGDARIIAATRVIGGGESASATFPGSKLEAGGGYRFFCTVPGHLALMTGRLIVE
jgi:azurin